MYTALCTTVYTVMYTIPYTILDTDANKVVLTNVLYNN